MSVPAAPALIEAATGRVYTHAAFAALAEHCATVFGQGGGKRLFILAAANRAISIAALHGLLQAGHAVLLCAADIAPATLRGYAATYRPHGIILPADRMSDAVDGYAQGDGINGLSCLQRQSADAADLHPDLALLLATSGSTGGQKMVRLSRRNIAANTAAIIQVLGITAQDRAAAHLPPAYSYGLSVILTHLAAGASLLLCDQSLTTGAFWQALRQHRVTSLPGVPTHFDFIKRLGLDQLNVPDLYVLTQAGGRLAPDLVRFFAETMQQRGGRFFAMYGQTEASPRMTVLPPEQATLRPASVGLPLPQGEVAIEDGEVMYRGPNVMLGYAEAAADLQRGDDCGGRLVTGDLGYLDAEGYLFLTGRARRIAKIDGLRIGLDEVEALAATVAPTAAFEHNGHLVLLTTGDIAVLRQYIQSRVQLHPSRILCQSIAAIPLLANGKRDMRALKGLLL